VVYGGVRGAYCPACKVVSVSRCLTVEHCLVTIHHLLNYTGQMGHFTQTLNEAIM